MANQNKSPALEDLARNMPITNPIKANEAAELPKDAVAILIWRKFTGPQSVTIVVTKISWDMNIKLLVQNDLKFDPERVYEFESPITSTGRRTVFHFQDVIGWAANIDIGPPSGGIIPASGD